MPSTIRAGDRRSSTRQTFPMDKGQEFYAASAQSGIVSFQEPIMKFGTSFPPIYHLPALPLERGKRGHISIWFNEVSILNYNPLSQATSQHAVLQGFAALISLSAQCPTPSLTCSTSRHHLPISPNLRSHLLKHSMHQ
jgi:hypothetical protein